MLAQAFAKSLHNLMLPAVWKLFLLCLLAYVVGMAALSWVAGALLVSLVGAYGGEGMFIQGLGTLGGFWLAWFLFPLLYPVLMGFFDDYMAENIEREDYPQLPPPNAPFWPTLAQDAWFSVKALLLNVVLIPFYLIPLVGWALYYLVNGYLLGTQFFRMSAGRRISLAEADQLRRRARGSIILGGIIISFCATVPVLNLAAPVLGVATMLHLFHALKGSNDVKIIAMQK